MKFSIETQNDNGSGMKYATKEALLNEISMMVDDCVANGGTWFDIVIDSDASVFRREKPDNMTPSFTVDLYMPVTASLVRPLIEWECEDEEDGEDTERIDSRRAVEFYETIRQGFIKFANSAGMTNGEDFIDVEELENAGLKRKIASSRLTVDVCNGRLMAKVHCDLFEDLTEKELSDLKDLIEGDMSDGFGECFEQNELEGPNGSSLYVHLWYNDTFGGEPWSIKVLKGVNETAH